jgi:voltage-gated potassium channel
VEGRIVAGALMLGGIALLGVVTASIASWFGETVRATGEEVAREAEQDTERQAERTSAQLDAVLAELRVLHARLDVLEAARTVGVPRQDDTRLAGGHSRS